MCVCVCVQLSVVYLIVYSSLAFVYIHWTLWLKWEVEPSCKVILAGSTTSNRFFSRSLSFVFCLYCFSCLSFHPSFIPSLLQPDDSDSQQCSLQKIARAHFHCSPMGLVPSVMIDSLAPPVNRLSVGWLRVPPLPPTSLLRETWPDYNFRSRGNRNTIYGNVVAVVCRLCGFGFFVWSVAMGTASKMSQIKSCCLGAAGRGCYRNDL